MKQQFTIFLAKQFLFIPLLFSTLLHAQTITGIVKDANTNETLFGASVIVKGTTQGAITDVDGKFTFKSDTLPVTILVTNIGYISLEQKITSIQAPLLLKIKPDNIFLSAVEVADTRITEKQKESPLTIETLDVIAIKETPAANFYEGLGQLKGVDITAASIGFRIINTRGFNSTSPVRSLQTIDGVDNQAPGLNFSLGNFLGSSELDVQKAEIIVGASSAYYGPNAFNGVISMTTKSPFIKPGLNILVKFGERNLVETAFRYAEVFKNKNNIEKFAFKINASYMQAHDWEANNMDPSTQSADGKDNWGGYDAVNRYGDENLTEGVNNATSKGQQINYPGLKDWYRTGYEEKDLVDYNTKNIKLAAALHYKITPETELVYAFNFGTGTTVYQGDNRYSLKDILFFQNKLEWVKKDKFFIRAYATNENAGNSYDAVFTAFLLQDRAKSMGQWTTDYRNFWAGAVPANSPNYVVGGMKGNVKKLPNFPVQGGPPNYYYDYDLADAIMQMNAASLLLWHSYARYYADNTGNTPFLIPGTAEYNAAFNEITSKATYGEGGSKFVDKSALYHIQGEYKFTPKITDIIVGGNYRLYAPNSQGTIFSDTNGVKITNYEFGGYLGLEKKVINDHLKINFTTRVDKNKNFNFVISPAASLVYTLKKENIIRISFSSAVRNPTLQDQYLYYNVGRAILLGNLHGFDSLVTIESIKDYYSATLINKDKLVYFDVAPVQPEKVKSVELGYRTLVFKRLYVDGSFYYSVYKHFLGYQLGGDVHFAPAPNQNNISSITFYRVAANSTNIVTTQGASVGMTYYFKKFFSLNGNYSWNQLNKKGTDDPIIPAYNTPANKFNIGFSGREIATHFSLFSKLFKNTEPIAINNFGFSINYKWVQGYLYEGSPQFTGYVPTYDMLDAQISKYVPKLKTTFKLGASNILNNKKFQVYGGPEIGRMAYFSALLELNK